MVLSVDDLEDYVLISRKNYNVIFSFPDKLWEDQEELELVVVLVKILMQEQILVP